MAGRKRAEPDLLAYTDFRKYLRDYYDFRKSQDRRFSYGVFARKAGIPARGHLQAVLQYGLTLTPETLSRYRKALGLTGPKAEYFSLLVALDQAKDDKELEIARTALRLWRKNQSWKRITAPEAHEIFLGARLLVYCLKSFPGFREDPVWISRRLLGAVSPQEVREALGFLERWNIGKAGIFEDPDGPDHTEPYRRLLYRVGARRANRSRGYGGLGNMHLVPLTRKQAVELHEKLDAWLRAHIPEPIPASDTELCVVVGDVFAASAPVEARKAS